MRFELTRPLRAYRFSRPAHSAALPLLRAQRSNLSGRGEGFQIAPRLDSTRLAGMVWSSAGTDFPVHAFTALITRFTPRRGLGRQQLIVQLLTAPAPAPDMAISGTSKRAWRD